MELLGVHFHKLLRVLREHAHLHARGGWGLSASAQSSLRSVRASSSTTQQHQGLPQAGSDRYLTEMRLRLSVAFVAVLVAARLLAQLAIPARAARAVGQSGISAWREQQHGARKRLKGQNGAAHGVKHALNRLRFVAAYHRNFVRPLALMRFAMALGARKPPALESLFAPILLQPAVQLCAAAAHHFSRSLARANLKRAPFALAPWGFRASPLAAPEEHFWVAVFKKVVVLNADPSSADQQRKNWGA